MSIYTYIDNFINNIPEWYRDIYWKYETPTNQAFFLACSFDDNINNIIAIIKNYYIDVDYCDKSGNNGFLFACWFNKNLDVIKFLIDNLKISGNVCNNFGKNGFLLACEYNNLKNVKFIQNFLKMDHLSFFSTFVFCDTLRNNKNIDVVEYIINYFKKDIYTSYDINSEINTIFQESENIELIIFLIEKARINIINKQIYNLEKIMKFKKSNYHHYLDFIWKNHIISSTNINVHNKINFIDIHCVNFSNSVIIEN